MFNEFRRLVDACGVDTTLDCYDNNECRLTFEDFEGFNSDWEEVMREYHNPDAVDALVEWLETHYISKDDSRLYTIYYFSDFKLTTGCASFDI